MLTVCVQVLGLHGLIPPLSCTQCVTKCYEHLIKNTLLQASHKETKGRLDKENLTLILTQKVLKLKGMWVYV